MIFCFLSLAFMYACQSSMIAFEFWTKPRDSYVSTLHSLLPDGLAHGTVLATYPHPLYFLLRYMMHRYRRWFAGIVLGVPVSIALSAFLCPLFSTPAQLDHHGGLALQQHSLSIVVWSDDCTISGLVLQCSSFG